MAFTTKQILVSDKPEIFPGKTVLIQHPYIVEEGKKSNTYFTLNKDAMLAFKLTPYVPNINNITWGIDDETKDLMLAAIGGDAKSSRVTANNQFSNGLFMDKLVKQFNIDPAIEHVFYLDIYEENGIFVAQINTEETVIVFTEGIEEPYLGFDDTINQIHADNALATEKTEEEVF